MENFNERLEFYSTDTQDVLKEQRSILEEILGNSLHRDMAKGDYDKFVEHISDDVMCFIDDNVINFKGFE